MASGCVSHDSSRRRMIMSPRLKFEDGKACLVCANCKLEKQLVSNNQIRLEHIFDFITASIRSQGYQAGYLCLKCEKKLNINTRIVRKWCKKYLTVEYFSHRNVKVL